MATFNPPPGAMAGALRRPMMTGGRYQPAMMTDGEAPLGGGGGPLAQLARQRMMTGGGAPPAMSANEPPGAQQAGAPPPMPPPQPNMQAGGGLPPSPAQAPGMGTGGAEPPPPPPPGPVEAGTGAPPQPTMPPPQPNMQAAGAAPAPRGFMAGGPPPNMPRAMMGNLQTGGPNQPGQVAGGRLLNQAYGRPLQSRGPLPPPPSGQWQPQNFPGNPGIMTPPKIGVGPYGIPPGYTNGGYVPFPGGMPGGPGGTGYKPRPITPPDRPVVPPGGGYQIQ